MAIKNQALTVCYTAWDTANNVGKTNDAANHTLRLVRDGVEATPTNTPAQIDATNLPGIYSLALTAAEMNVDYVTIGGKSATAQVVIVPTHVATERASLSGLATAAALNRALGLLWENAYTDNATYDASGNLLTARLRTYSIAASVGTDNDVLATYALTATYDSDKRLSTFKGTKE